MPKIYNITKEEVFHAIGKRFKNLPEKISLLRAIGKDGKDLYRLYYDETFIGCNKTIVLEIPGDFFGALMQDYLEESREFNRLVISVSAMTDRIYSCYFDEKTL